MTTGARLGALLAAALFLAGCTLPRQISSLPDRLLGGRIHLTADFASAAGLYPGNEVAVLGVPVGSVDAVTPKGRFVEVAMTLDPGTAVSAEAVAALVSPQFITNRHIELYPGHAGDGPVLADGAHLPLARTRTPVELDRILRTFDELGRTLAGDATAGPLSSRVLFPVLDGNGDRIRATLGALATAFRTTLGNKDQISDAIVRLNDLTAVFAENDRTVRDFSARLTELVTLMREQAPGLRAVLAQLDGFVTDVSALVAENRQPLIAALTRLTTVLAQMRGHGGELTEIVDVAPLFFENFAAAVDPGTRTARLHLLTDKSLLDGEALAVFCERVQLRADGCRTGRITDLGPDLGVLGALLGLLR
ncbi:MCE family protein [Nocardia thailandica]|uniref:MCE family protein n=1 Tax=Nocardia thailandica TaxID=257275 RepID=UPI0002FDA234|nr:MCE family protein [Nocardia thailandica]